MGVGGVESEAVDEKCAEGYDGVLCNACAAGWAGLSGFCTKCYSPALASVGVILVVSAVTGCVAILTAMLLQENTGTNMVGALSVCLCVCDREIACVCIAL